MRARGFFTPSLVAALLVVIFIAVLFGTRVREKAEVAGPRYSDRYHELKNRPALSAAEEAELELETCRYRRDHLAYLKHNALVDYERARSNYAQTCARLLPLN